MNADMLRRGTEDRTAPLSLFFSFLGGGGSERPLRPPLESPLNIMVKTCMPVWSCEENAYGYLYSYEKDYKMFCFD